GAVQAYIFAVLATVFIGAAAGESPGRNHCGATKEDTSP
ncbi:MAG TPA: F0F1 ATP synthase subunit A, partial [Rhodobacteraceae bacterium]|nr:F0F1 ATP synthase subunit A [Paracoccaceae bacterium]